MWQKLKKFGCYLIIIVLLPYVITVFIHGADMEVSSHVDETYVTVKLEDGTALETPIEDYCIGIMAKEIPADYEKEALKAQAVLVRTDIYRKIEKEGSRAVFDTSFWTREQMEEAWGAAGRARYYNKLKSAWQSTEGEILMYDGAPAKTPFFRLSNGSTRDAQKVLGKKYPYLQTVDCPKDIEAVEQIQTVTLSDLEAEVAECDETGYVLKVKAGDETVSGEEFRKNYHLASSCFTIQKYNGKLRITTRGIGHGVGMSQYTANAMAKEGKTYDVILEYFFEGTNLQEVTDIVREEEEGTEEKQTDGDKK